MTTVNNKLEMVNTVLLEVGESAVNSLDNSRAVRNVLTLMDREKRRIMSNKGQGYSFNLYKYDPVQDVNGYYILPENTLIIKTEGSAQLAIRDNKIFDVANNTFSNIYFKDLELVMDIDYDDLPTLADEYIVNATIYRWKKAQGFSQNEINEAFGIRRASEDAMNEQEIYTIQQAYANNRFRNPNVYTQDTSRNNTTKI